MSVIDSWGAAKAGDVLKSRTGVEFVVTEVVDGHVWGNVKSLILGECCRVCGLMRRRDKQNKPCKGPVQITMREKA